MNDDELGQEAYRAYGDAVGWRNFQGDPMPNWLDLPAQIRAGWEAAARAVAGIVDPDGSTP